MKYLAIVLMPTSKGVGSFKLSDLLQKTHNAITSEKNIDSHFTYQTLVADKLVDAYHFLQTLNVERDSRAFQQEAFLEDKLTYVVLGVSDNYQSTQPLETSVVAAYFYYPDNHIHAELNAATDENEKRLKECSEQFNASLNDELSTKAEQQDLLKKLEDQRDIKKSLDQRWAEYLACPMQCFQLKSLTEEVELTPKMSPVLRRSVALVGEKLKEFYNASEAPNLFNRRKSAEVETGNNNNETISLKRK